uniref:Late embryogenesis abundant protein LEA-2 subgroup domain-containing protein n=1 Tax=Rhizophora mucronata TaxID=61149 RepID=A0A2P2MQY5_RHIMU
MEKVSLNPSRKEFAVAKAAKRRRRNICLGVTVAVILVVVLVVVILAFTVFKAKRPVTTVDSVSLKNLQMSVDVARLVVNLNLTLDVDLSIKNPNKVSIKYTNSSASLNYRGKQVGEVPIPAGKISADKTQPMNLTVNFMASQLFSDRQFFSDVVTTGVLPLNAFTRISGKVRILKMFRVRVISRVSCDITVLLSNQTIGQQNCQYKSTVKL